MKTVLIAMIASAALSGCAGDLVGQRAPYDKAPEQEIAVADEAYVVQIADGKALIRPTLATAFKTTPYIPHYRAAVLTALNKTGRACRVTEGYPNGDFYEFTYICK